MLKVGKKLGLGMLFKSPAKAKTKQMIVQKGGGMGRSIRQGPPKRQINTIPSAKYVMYHQ
jgi:hypothetical protein